MASLTRLERQRPQGFVAAARPPASRGSQPARSVAPVTAPGDSPWGQMQAYMATREEQKKQEEEDKGNPFGRGLGFLVNNPVTQTIVKPFQAVDYMRRGVTLGVEEGAEFLSGLLGGADELQSKTNPDGTRSEFGKQSNWDKLRDPAYGGGDLIKIGDMLPGTWNDDWGNRLGGFVTDIAFDPLSYVGGIGVATKAAGAGGRASRIANASRAFDEARKSGRVVINSAGEITKGQEIVDDISKVLRQGYSAGSKELQQQMGIRGGVRLTSNPLSPYKGLQGTIPGSERITAPLSRARVATGNWVGNRGRIGEKLSNVRTPRVLEPDYNRAFLGKNADQLSLPVALDSVGLYNDVKNIGSAFAQPLTRMADRVAHDARKYTKEQKRAIIDSLETEGAKLSPEAKRFQAIFDAAWERANSKKFGSLPLEKRKNYAPHILSRDAIAWRRNPENAGKIVAPTGFFTEARYDPSGVTMARQFEIGDEFVVNNTPVKIEKGTITEINDKFRSAGLNFNFFEEDPGVVLQKYINMLQDDVGQHAGALKQAKRTGNQGLIRNRPVGPDGNPIDGTPEILRGGGRKVTDQEADLARISEQLGMEEPLDPAMYRLEVDKELTKETNKSKLLEAQRNKKAARDELSGLRARISEKLATASRGEAVRSSTPAAPGVQAQSLKQDLKDAKGAYDTIAAEVKESNAAVRELSGERDQVLDRVAWHGGVVDELGGYVEDLQLLMKEIGDSGPRDLMRDLQEQYDSLKRVFDEGEVEKARARRRIEQINQTAFDGRIEQELLERRDSLYREAGMQPPSEAPKPNLGAVAATEPGVQAYPQVRLAAEIENRIANNMAAGKSFKDDLKQLSELTGQSEDDIRAELKRRGVVRPQEAKAVERPASIPSRSSVTKAVKEARQEIQNEAQDFIDTNYNGALVGPGSVMTSKQVAEAAKAKGITPNDGEWDAIRIAYDRMKSTAAGRKIIRVLQSRKLIAPLKSPGAKYTNFKPDDWASRFDTVDDAVDQFFEAGRRLVGAQAKEPSAEVIERATIKLGISDTELVTAASDPAAYNKAVEAAASNVDDVAEAIGEEGVTRLASQVGDLDMLPDEADRARALMEEIEGAIQASGGDPREYEELLSNPQGVLDRLRRFSSRDENAIPEPTGPTGPEFGPTQAPERVPSSQIANEYEELSQVRRQRQDLIDEQQSVAGMERRIQELNGRKAQLARELGLPADRPFTYAAVEPVLEPRRRKLVNRAQDEALAGNADDAQELTRQANAMTADSVVEQGDILDAQVMTLQENIEDIKRRGPEIRAQIAALDEDITKRGNYIQARVKTGSGETTDQQIDRLLNRLFSRDENAKRSVLEQLPERGKGGTPNIEAGGRAVSMRGDRGGVRTVNEGAAVRDIGERVKVVPDGEVRDALVEQHRKIRYNLGAARRRIKDLRAQVRDHPRVTRNREAAAKSSSTGGTRFDRALFPERPTPAPKSQKVELDEATKLWSKQVDEIIDNLDPPQGSPMGREPMKFVAEDNLRRSIREVSEDIGLSEAKRVERLLLDQESDLFNMLSRFENVADDPAAVAALSKEIKAMTARSELDAIAAGRRAIPATRKAARTEQETMAALIENTTPGQQRIASEMGDVVEQQKELFTPEGQRAAREDALRQPSSQKVVEETRRKQAELNASQSILSAGETRLGQIEPQLAEQSERLAQASQGQLDATKTVGQAKGVLARAKKVSPKNRGNLKVEEFLEAVLAEDPGLKDVSNLAFVQSIIEAEELAEQIPAQLRKLENAKISNLEQTFDRAVIPTLIEDTWSAMAPDISGPHGALIHKDLKARLQNIQQITNDNAFFRMLDNMTGLFKTYATLTPGFHVRNALSAAFMNASDGVDVATQVQGMKWMRQYGQAAKEGDKAVEAWLQKMSKEMIGDSGYSVADALDAIAGTGVGGRYREFGIGDRSSVKYRANERAFENFATYHIGKVPGTFIESSVRLPLAIDTLAKGGNIDEAVRRITRIHFDYQEVSKFDQTMRRLIPFWTFMSRNLPLQVAQIWTNPRAYAKYNSFVRNARGPANENEPDYFGSIGAFPLGEAQLFGLPLYLQPDLPHTRLVEDLEKASDLLSGENTLRAFSDFNPLFTAPAEFATERNFYTGKEYGDTDKRQTGLIEKPLEILARIVGQADTTPEGKVLVNENFLNAFRSVIPVYDRSIRLAPNAVTGGSDSDASNRWAESIGRTIGLPIRQLSPQQQQSQAMSEYYDQAGRYRYEQWLAAQDG